MATLVRALNNAADQYWKRGREPEISKKLTDWATEIEFGPPQFSDRTKLRSDLQFRASRLLGNWVEASLNRFARAAADEGKSDRPWLEAVVMVIAEKPAASWTDEDVIRFELSLSDLSRRFKNLEVLQAAVKATSRGGFEARRVTVTRPDGTEVNKMVWADHEHQAKVDSLIEQLLQQCPDPQLQQALGTGTYLSINFELWIRR
ncbi:hypothetical protein PN498_00085 [Oscillatoria sp. CS-180]|uniref:hypothetical protein n=1 Tax=Oscillatoria sp. CS-180 TaxID=3021720 RepID=UPI00232D01BC|nr:hypothetical protein [Oscillatoria sp. CS-180]MDB9524368.1 hypothetical protein [Oscillatoria sp. CS-180]